MPMPPELSESAFHAAVRTGDLAAMASLLEKGADVNERRDLEVGNGSFMCKLTPLMVAARSIDGAGVATLQWLLDHGADLRAVSEAGVTAAWYAAGKGGRREFHPYTPCPDFVDRLRLLLDRGLDPNEMSDNGQTLLAEACGAGDPARVRLLLDRGADFQKAPGRQGPLSIAAAAGSAECVVALLAAGADIHARDNWGMTALMYAGSVEVVNVLLQAGLDVNDRNSDGSDVLHVVLSSAERGKGLCATSKFDIARELVRLGARLDQRGSKFGNTRLYEAAFSQDPGVVSLLLDLGCRPTPDSSNRSRTPLHAICWQGERRNGPANEEAERIIRLLVAAGADVNAPDEHGSTPLHEACDGDSGNATAVRTLLELGAAPDPVDEHGQTPLMLAADVAETGCIQALLAAGADPLLPDEEGCSSLDRARDHLATWKEVAGQPVSFWIHGMSDDQMRDMHRDLLCKAEQAVALFIKHGAR